jgi:asparagine synthase (glutamine-hydrolysing)
MSVITGLWNFSGDAPDLPLLESVARQARQYASGPQSSYFRGSVGMIYQPFDAGRAESEKPQPHRAASGSIMMWNGRLDNRAELIAFLGDANDGTSSPHNDPMLKSTSDVDIAHAIFCKCGSDGLRKITGDWALTVWDGLERRLVLACDFCGIRHLYYCQLPNSVLWCTDLKAIVAGSHRQFHLCDAYIAEYLEAMPTCGRTPYREIKAVPPGHWVEITELDVTVHRYWNWDTRTPILYKSDAEYEEHFRHVFRQSVKRRLRSKRPVMAELSGGLDSSSIVCMADDILEREGAPTPQLHTVSSYHEEEPSCDERPYFSVIEQTRGRTGTHIKTHDTLTLDLPMFLAIPVYPQGLVDGSTAYWGAMRDHAACTLLSGIGGDEFLGGVPTGVPELADFVRARDFAGLAAGIGRWSIASKLSRWQLLHASLGSAHQRTLQDAPYISDRKSTLLTHAFSEWARSACVSTPIEWLDPAALPSQRIFVEAWCELLRHSAYWQPPIFGCYEHTYPYLDQDLLSFLINIPRSQVIRAGERRSLMRRALASLVPREVLWRRNKATSSRRYMRTFTAHSAEIVKRFSKRQSEWVRYGFVDGDRFVDAFHKACNGLAEYNQPVMRVLGLDAWSRLAMSHLSPIEARTSSRAVRQQTELPGDLAIRMSTTDAPGDRP